MTTVEPLGPQHLSALKTMLGREPAHNLYLLGILEDYGVVSSNAAAPFAFYGRLIDGALTAVVFVGGNGGLVVPSASPAQAVTDIASWLVGRARLGSALGEKHAVDVLVQFLSPKPELSMSKSQRLYSVSADDLGPFTNPTLRLATESDVPQLVPMAAAAVREIMGREPLVEDPEGFEQRVRLRVQSRRTYVLEEQGQLVFKLDIGSRSSFGAELEGLYTVPEHRQRGHATLCLGQISRHLLSSLPRLTLRIDDDHRQLATMARKVGYVAGRAQRLVVS